MALFQLPEKIKLAEEIEKLDAELGPLKEQADIRGRVLSELTELITALRQDDSRLKSARKTIFALMQDKLRQAELSAADDYEAFITSEVETIEQREQKKGGDKKGGDKA